MEFTDKITLALPEYGLDAVLLTGETNIRYATGFPSTDSLALVTRTGAYFFTDSRYTEAAQAVISGSEVLEVTGRARMDKLAQVLEADGASVLGFEENVLTYAGYESFSGALNRVMKPAGDMMTALRAAKSDDEFEVMKKAQRIAEKAFTETVAVISEDMTERELAAELLYRMLKNGAEGPSFDTIAVSGPRTSMPHGVPGDNRIGKGFLTIDFGVKYCGYCSDTTRTLCMGEPTDKMRRVYETVLEAQKAGIAAARSGIPGNVVDRAGRDVIEKAGFGQYFGHSFGHSLGLDIHESPNFSPSEKRIIPEGAVLSAEPGIYIPGEFGVRIEDVVRVYDGGCEDITALPRELTVL